MSWDAPPPGEREPEQPAPPHQPAEQYEPTQPFSPPAPPYGQPMPPEQPTAPYPVYPAPYGQQAPAPGAQPTQPIGYGQPPPQWNQPQWNQPQWGQPPGQFGGPYYPAPTPPKRRRTGFYVALSIAAVVVAAGVAIAVAATSSKSGGGAPAALGTNSAGATSAAAAASTGDASGDNASSTPSADTSQTPHSLVVPTTAGPLQLVNNADTARRIAAIRSSLSGNTAYLNPRIAFYSVGPDDSFSVWLLAETSSDVPSFKVGVNLLGDDAMAHQVADGAHMTDVTTESPGPLGGAVLCGKIPADGTELRVCEWVDDSTFGWVYFLPSVNSGDMVTYTQDLRGSAEQ
jgi:hypothetical protein